MNNQNQHSSIPQDSVATSATNVPVQEAPLTTADPSGYPDRHDGLATVQPNSLQDHHEHHKHNQVIHDPAHTLGTSQDRQAPAHHTQTQAHDHHHHHHHPQSNAKNLVDKPIVEVAEQLGETELPMGTIVPLLNR